MNKLISILIIMFLMIGTSVMDAKPPKKNGFLRKSRVTTYRSAKFKKKRTKQSNKNYKKACKYHNQYKEYTERKKRNKERGYDI